MENLLRSTLPLDGEADASASDEAGARGVPASILSIRFSLSLSISLLSISLSGGEVSGSAGDKGNSFGDAAFRVADSAVTFGDIGASPRGAAGISSNVIPSKCSSGCVLSDGSRGEV